MSYVAAAFAFGLVAGINPGPLGVFVIHQTMSRGFRSGLFASCVPIVTDLPIVVIVALLTLKLGELDWFVAVISIIGSLYLAVIAYRIFESPGEFDTDAEEIPSVDWLAGVKMNFLNPVPYIFWGTVGSAYINRGTLFEACIFVAVLLVTLCSSKFVVAVAIKTLGDRFSPRIYAGILRVLALPLLFFSAKLFVSGVGYVWP